MAPELKDCLTLIEYMDGILARLEWLNDAGADILCPDCYTFYPNHAEGCCIQAARKAAAVLLKK